MRRILLFVIFLTVITGCKNKGGKHLQEQSLAIHPGKVVYDRYCLACHQVDGSGVPGMYPPLKKADWAALDDEKLIRILLQGVSGEIEVDGEVYNGQMPAHHFLTDQQVSNVLTYLRSQYGNISKQITPGEVGSIRNTIQNE